MEQTLLWIIRNPKSNPYFLKCPVSQQLFQRKLKVFNNSEKSRPKLYRAHSNTGAGIITLCLRSFERDNPRHRLFQIPANISGSSQYNHISYVSHFPKMQYWLIILYLKIHVCYCFKMLLVELSGLQGGKVVSSIIPIKNIK